MARNYVPIDTESQLFDELDERRAKLQANLSRATPDSARVASEFSKLYPDVEPGVVQSLVESGISPSSPQAQEIAKLSAAKSSDEGRQQDPHDDVPQGFLETLGGAVLEPLKTGIRAGFTAIAAPFEEAAALTTSIGEAAFDDDPGFLGDAMNNFLHEAAPSHLRLIAGGRHEFEDLGEGFIPAGSVRQTKEEMKHNLTIDGHFLTPGRTMLQPFTEVVEPGTDPYNIASGVADFAFNIFGDPAVWVAGPLAKAAQSRKTFQAAGIFDGLTKGVAKDPVKAFMNKPATRDAVDWIAKNDNMTEIWKALDKPRASKMLVALKENDDPQKIQQILESAFGTTVRERPGGMFSPFTRGPGYRIKRTTENYFKEVFPNFHRAMGANIPGIKLDPDAPGRMLDHVHDYAVNAKLPDEQLAHHMENFARVEAGDKTGMFNAAEELMEDVFKKLRTAGIKDSEAKEMTRIFRNVHKDGTAYFIDQTGKHYDMSKAVKAIAGDEAITAPDPHMVNELINQSIWLPDFREVRRATGNKSVRWLLDTKIGSTSAAFTDWAMSNVWKPLVLARAAWTVRVIGEEQARMAASGLDSMANHPLSALAWITSESDSKVGSLLSKVAGQKGTKTLHDEIFGEVIEHQKAMSRAHAGWLGLPGEMSTGFYKKVRRGDKDYWNGWATEMHQMGTEPVMARVAGGLTDADKASIKGGLSAPKGFKDRKYAEVLPTEWVDEFKEFDRAAKPLDPKRFQSLKDDIAENGIQDELILEVSKEGQTAILIEGNHRLAAAKELGIDELPVRVVTRNGPHQTTGIAPNPIPDRIKFDPDDPYVPSMTQPSNVFKGLVDDVEIDGIDGNDLDNIKEWFWSGTGQKWRQELGQVESKQALLSSRQAADEYIDTYVHRLHMKTGGRVVDGEVVAAGHDDLIEAVGRGELQGVKFKDLRSNKPLRDTLEEAYSDVAPEWVKAEVNLRATGRSGRTIELANQYDMAVQRMFSILMEKPTDTLSRSPAFRQNYWKRVDELLLRADNATQHRVLEKAEEANVGQRLLKSMRDKVGNTQAGKVELAFDDVDQLAKGHALDATRDLLYDLSRRSQWADITRNFIPFGEAWKEILTSWGKITKRNPTIIRRFQQGFEGAKGSGWLQPRDPNDPNSDLMFTYPGSGLVSNFLLRGNPLEGGETSVRFQGRLQSLNLVGSVLPGFGPVVQVPANQLLPDKPQFDDIRNIVDPFGEPGAGITEATLGSIIPSWVQKAKDAMTGNPETDRMFANTVMDTMRALVREGDYSTNSEEEIRRLTKDAKTKAKLIYAVRALGQFTGPTGPTPTWETMDASNNWITVQALSNEYRKLLDEYPDEGAAFQEFLRKFGAENILGIQGKTRRLEFRPSSDVGHAWLRSHEAQKEKFPQVIGLFAPEGNPDSFSYDAYLKSIREGAREQLQPEEMAKLSNRFVGWVAYNQAKRMAENKGVEGQLFLAKIREQLKEEYPGFQGHVEIEERADTDEMIRQLKNAVQDPQLGSTKAGQAIQDYLALREQAQSEVDQYLDVQTFKSAKSASYVRDWLRGHAHQLIEEHGQDFAKVWNSVFKNELAEDR